MFDANMRHLPNGLIFFAEVFTVKKNSSLGKFGYNKNELVLCEMLDNDEENDHNNSKVRFYNKGETLDCKSWEDGEDLLSTWIVFAGCYEDCELQSFLPQDEARLKPLAMKLLKENKLCHYM